MLGVLLASTIFKGVDSETPQLPPAKPAGGLQEEADIPRMKFVLG